MSSVRRRAPRVSKDCPRSPLGGSPTVCRACLRLERNMSELFLSSGDEDSIKDKVEFCTGLEISETDDLPNHICQTCLILLDSAYQFKTTCLYSDTTLRRKLIKTEPFEQHQGTCNNDTIVHSLYNAKCKTNNGDASEKDCLSMQIIGEDDLSAKKTTNDCLMANITNASLLSAQIINEDHISPQIINTDLLSRQITDKHLTSKRTNRDRITARAMKKVRSSSSRKKERRKTKHETEHDKTVNRNDASLNDFPIKLEVKIEQDVNDDDSRYDGASDDSDDVLKDVKLRKCATTRKLQSSEQSSNKRKPAEPLKPERLLTRSRPLWCETCQVKFPDKAAVMEHRKQHQAEDTALSFVCEICGKIFKHRSSHYYHQRSHLPPEFSCQQCNYVTWHKHDLEKHKSTHTGLKRYQCELCPCAYHCSSNLHSHIRRIHERRRDHTCPICQHKFFDRRKMQQHIDSHNDIKRYSCEICGTGLSRRNYWTRHMLRQHGVVVETPRPGRHKTNLVIAEKKPPEELSVNAECDKIAT